MGCAAVLSRPQAQPALRCPAQSQADCAASLQRLPLGPCRREHWTRTPEGRRREGTCTFPSTRCPSSSPAAPSISAVKDKPSPGGPVAWLLSELPESATSHPFRAPGVPQQPPVRSTGLSSSPAGLPAAASHSYCRCVTSVFPCYLLGSSMAV